jgi:nucleoside-diphosphate-sugar epimerase
LVGGWIVKNLLDNDVLPAAIRILDLRPSTRSEVIKNNIAFFTTDVTSKESLHDAFTASWPTEVADFSFTIIDCVAMIGPADRKEIMVDPYVRVNIEGTKNVLAAAQELHKSQGRTYPMVFVATSSGSISITPPTYFQTPFSPAWFRTVFSGAPPPDFCQFVPNGEPPQHHLLSDIASFGSCYAFSKARAEYYVRQAHDSDQRFLTGCIRPAHAIYGHGVENTNSLSYDYLRRGGSPTWMYDIVGNFVDARNVSLGHLWYEHALLKELTEAEGVPPGCRMRNTVGGQAYAVTDPNPPITYGHLYRLLALLAYPKTPKFPRIPPIPMLCMGYFIEAYVMFREGLVKEGGAGRFIAKFMPPLSGDLIFLQPGTFQIATLNLVYDDSLAREQLGYKSCVNTMRGLVDSVLEWNEKSQQKVDGNSYRKREHSLVPPVKA